MKSIVKGVKEKIYLKYHYIKNFKFKIAGSSKDKIVFIVPNRDVTLGGTMSVSTMGDIAQELFPNKDVHLGVINKIQGFTKYSGFQSNFEIINLNIYLKKWIKSSNILFHVCEILIIDFLDYINEHIDKEDIDKIQINILNQNHQMLPSEAEIKKHLGKVKSMTMTLAYHANTGYRACYLKHSPIHVGAMYPKTKHDSLSFEQKENLCIISPDENEYKDRIKQLLEENGIRCFDSWPVPYEKFLELQSRAKWTISFGEGWDGYSSGQFTRGGIGFGVYQSEFSQSYFNEDKLPVFLFKSYEEMHENIVDTIKSLDNKDSFTSLNKHIMDIRLRDSYTNDPIKVKSRWILYYNSIGYICN